MRGDHELILIKPGGRTKDNIGNEIITDPVETPVLCDLRSVGRNEFYSAATAGMAPEMVFVIHPYEYAGEQLVKFEDVKYQVIRTYSDNDEELELVCGKVKGK
ncbi:phage head closure protein [Paenibacillus pabuli]|uniref:phage head closure protein n=1 Tax=Paenibacillus pabuli TaxID=1472 RepID=UPI001FFF6A9C|nr:phage head closure protein [Paenibacillus pabuli]UPK45764.1 phage head closure protein [Paenibacillus pabuli]